MAGELKGVNVNGTACQIDYESLANKPSIPSKVSDLENDLGFITESGSPEADWDASEGEPGYIKNRLVYNEYSYSTGQYQSFSTIPSFEDCYTTPQITVDDKTFRYARVSSFRETVLPPELYYLSSNTKYRVIDSDGHIYCNSMRIRQDSPHISPATNRVMAYIIAYPFLLAEIASVMIDPNTHRYSSLIAWFRAESSDNTTKDIRFIIATKDINKLPAQYVDLSVVEQEISQISEELSADIEGKQDTLEFDNSPKKSSSNPVTSAGIYNAINQLKNTMQSKIDALQATISTMQSEIDDLKTRVALLEKGPDEDDPNSGSDGDGTNIGFDDSTLDLSGNGITFSDGIVDLNSPRITYNDGVVDIITGDGTDSISIGFDNHTLDLSGDGITFSGGTVDLNSSRISYNDGVVNITTGGGGNIGTEISSDGTVALSGAGVTMDNGTLDIRSNSFDNGVLDI